MQTEKRVIALGFFDGVHLGHGALLRRVGEKALELGAVPAAVTFVMLAVLCAMNIEKDMDSMNAEKAARGISVSG